MSDRVEVYLTVPLPSSGDGAVSDRVEVYLTVPLPVSDCASAALRRRSGV